VRPRRSRSSCRGAGWSRGRGGTEAGRPGSLGHVLKGRNLNSLARQRQVGRPRPPIRPEGAVSFSTSSHILDSPEEPGSAPSGRGWDWEGTAYLAIHISPFQGETKLICTHRGETRNEFEDRVPGRCLPGRRPGLPEHSPTGWVASSEPHRGAIRDVPAKPDATWPVSPADSHSLQIRPDSSG